MIFENDGSTVIITSEEGAFNVFMEQLNDLCETYKAHHIILNLLVFNNLLKEAVSELSLYSEQHKNRGYSFVLVTDKISYDEVPEELAIAPTIQEAKDIIEMESIERDLGL